MKKEILAVMCVLTLVLTSGFAFTSCKKADKSSPVAAEEKKTDASATKTDKEDDMKKEVDNASGFNFK